MSHMAREFGDPEIEHYVDMRDRTALERKPRAALRALTGERGCIRYIGKQPQEIRRVDD